jgi:hypothetical protein
MECESRPREDVNGETDDEQNEALVKNTVAKKAVKTLAKKAVKTVAKKTANTVAKKAVKTVAKKAVKTVAKKADKPQKFKCRLMWAIFKFINLIYIEDIIYLNKYL